MLPADRCLGQVQLLEVSDAAKMGQTGFLHGAWLDVMLLIGVSRKNIDRANSTRRWRRRQAAKQPITD